MWADIQITNARLRALYERNYFFGEEYTDYLADIENARRNFRRRLKGLQQFLPPCPGELFEIGCAFGVFLDLARSKFSKVSGIDISEDAVNYARQTFGLDVMCGDLLDADLGDSQYDAVCLWDTIEHLKTPDLYLQRVADHMPPGAILGLTTGDIASLNARFRRERWRLIHPPTHLHYFSVRSITRMLERAGFDLIAVEHCGASRSLGAIADGVLRQRWGWDGIGTFLRDSAIGRIPLYVNLFDIMYVVARRRGETIE